MIKNVALKKLLKASVFKVATLINFIVPKKHNIVLLYSANKGIQHSLIPLKKFLLNNSYQKKYRIICGIENMNYADDDLRVQYVPRLKAYQYFFIAKHVFYTTGQVPIKPSKSQCVIHLRHGNANFKTSGKKTKINNGNEFYFTYMAASAPMFKEIMCEEYGCSKDNIVVVGDPLVDLLFEKPSHKYEFSNYKKVIIWLPTFRQSDYLGYDDSILEDVVPLFKEEDYPKINSLLEKFNIKLIVKLHPAQNNLGQGERHFEYFDIYTNDEFLQTGYELYPLMARSDALIGDYSSASMQYLVLDRPQAYVVPDIEEYSKKRGFIFENPEIFMAGHIIKTKDEFEGFISDVSSGIDLYAAKRKNVCKQVYTYLDNHNCERIVRLSGMQ